MRPDIDDNVAGREARRQPILVEYDHPVENRLVQRAAAKSPSLAHEAPLVASALTARYVASRRCEALPMSVRVCRMANMDPAHELENPRENARSVNRSGAWTGRLRPIRSGFPCWNHQSEMTILRIVISLYSYCWSMIFSENRYPLFGIML